MPRTMNALQYSDVVPLLDRLEHVGSLRHICDTENQAIKLIQRCNTWRAHLREQGFPRFDMYLFRRDKNVLIFEPRPQLTGRTFDGQGNEIDLSMPLPTKLRPLTKEETEAAMNAPDLDKYLASIEKKRLT